ncbi:MAG: hypothetical protein OJF49_004578 [Ktedonobacterales bacterium]|nr:MAG: hypothetical protein OJF49_004578 [Ktedonobacterales bacterium]
MVQTHWAHDSKLSQNTQEHVTYSKWRSAFTNTWDYMGWMRK